MPEFRANYTAEEDAILLSVCNEARENGIPIASAYLKVADELQRPVGSVSNRYGRLVERLKNNGEMKYKPNKVVSESERLALKLKALKRDTERSVEKVDMFKEKYETLLKEHENLKKKMNTIDSEHEKKYHLLEVEHNKLIKVVREALGEDENGRQIEAS